MTPPPRWRTPSPKPSMPAIAPVTSSTRTMRTSAKSARSRWATRLHNALLKRGAGNRDSMTSPQRIEVIGIDHIYVTVSELDRSEKFYDAVMGVLGFRKNTFTNEGDPHIQYYNRHFGFVLRPARVEQSRHDPLSPGLHHFCFRVEDRT